MVAGVVGEAKVVVMVAVVGGVVGVAVMVVEREVVKVVATGEGPGRRWLALLGDR